MEHGWRYQSGMLLSLSDKRGDIPNLSQNGTFTLDTQKQFVANSTFQLSPGEGFPDESAPSSTTTSGSTPTSTDSPTPGSESQSASLSGGAIAGIAIGGIAAVAIVFALIYLCGRKGGIEKGYRQSKMISPMPSQMIGANYNDNGPKSPPMNSPYAMSSSYTETYRSKSPAAWGSQVGSPPNSYMGQHPSPGFPSYGASSPLMSGQQQHQYLYV